MNLVLGADGSRTNTLPEMQASCGVGLVEGVESYVTRQKNSAKSGEVETVTSFPHCPFKGSLAFFHVWNDH